MSDDIWEAEILEAEVYEEWIEEPLESIERREKRQLDVALASTGAIVIAFTILYFCGSEILKFILHQDQGLLISFLLRFVRFFPQFLLTIVFHRSPNFLLTYPFFRDIPAILRRNAHHWSPFWNFFCEMSAILRQFKIA